MVWQKFEESKYFSLNSCLLLSICLKPLKSVVAPSRLFCLFRANRSWDLNSIRQNEHKLHHRRQRHQEIICVSFLSPDKTLFGWISGRRCWPESNNGRCFPRRRAQQPLFDPERCANVPGAMKLNAAFDVVDGSAEEEKLRWCNGTVNFYDDARLCGGRGRLPAAKWASGSVMSALKLQTVCVCVCVCECVCVCHRVQML